MIQNRMSARCYNCQFHLIIICNLNVSPYLYPPIYSFLPPSLLEMYQTNASMECINSTDCPNPPPPFRCGIPHFLPPSLPEAFHLVQGGVWTLFLVLSVLLNSFVILLIFSRSTLRSREFLLTLQLNIIHLVFSLTVLPTMIGNAFAGYCVYTFTYCSAVGSVHDVYITVKFCLTLVMTLDRVFIIYMPYFYYKHGVKIGAVMSLAAWLVSIIRVVTLLAGPLNCYAYIPLFKVCTAVGNCSRACLIHTIFFSTCLAIFGMILPFILYIILLYKARTMNRYMKDLLHEMSDTRNSSGAKESTIYSHFLKNKPVFLQKHIRVLTTFLILTVALIGCSVPPYILYVLSFVVSREVLLNPIFSGFQVLVGRTLIYSLSVLDPLIIMRNKEVTKVLQKLWRRINKRNSTTPIPSIESRSRKSSLTPLSKHPPVRLTKSSLSNSEISH